MQTAMQFPQPLVERHRPQTLDAFVGVAQAKLAASAIINQPMANTSYLFAGESGLGKTTMALAIARALNAQLHHLPARRVSKEEIESVWDAVHYSPWGGGWGHVVLIDEADLLRI